MAFMPSKIIKNFEYAKHMFKKNENRRYIPMAILIMEKYSLPKRRKRRI
jgi:hypothetical protein